MLLKIISRTLNNQKAKKINRTLMPGQKKEPKLKLTKPINKFKKNLFKHMNNYKDLIKLVKMRINIDLGSYCLYIFTN